MRRLGLWLVGLGVRLLKLEEYRKRRIAFFIADEETAQRKYDKARAAKPRGPV